MVRHALIKQRINKEACRLKEFSARELCDVLNNYPNCNGSNRTYLQISTGRAANLLQANKNVKFIYNPSSLTRTGTWKWIGDEE